MRLGRTAAAHAGTAGGGLFARRCAFGLLIAAATIAVSPSSAATAIGKVSRLQGEASGTVEGITRGLAANDAVHLNEAVTTGEDARLEVTLDDQTVLTVGEKARLTLDAFVYRPEASVVKVTLAGAFRFVSGKAGASTARDASVTTPFAVIAVRGTDFWGGPIDGAFGVFLFEGAVAVSNAGVTVDLVNAGDGTNVATLAAVPEPPAPWAPDKAARAVATVTFR